MKKRKAPNRMYLSKQLQISKYNIVGGGGDQLLPGASFH